MNAPDAASNNANNITYLSDLNNNIPETTGIIKNEKTGMTPLISTAKTIDKPILKKKRIFRKYSMQCLRK